MCGHIRLQQGVTVGVASGHVLRGNGAAAARYVVDHQALAQHFGQTLAGGARNHVGTAASRNGHDVTNRFERVIALSD